MQNEFKKVAGGYEQLKRRGIIPVVHGVPAGNWFDLMPWAGASIIEGFTGNYWDVRLVRIEEIILKKC